MNHHVRNFLLYFFILFSLLIAAIGFIFNYYTNDSLFEVLFLYESFTLPLIIIMAIFTFIVTFIFYTIIRIVQYYHYKKIENALRDLNDGVFNSKLMKRILRRDKIQISPKIDHLIRILQLKLTSMSKEVVLAKEEQNSVSSETREEILDGERRRIARELHDSVSQQLFASAMILSAVNEQNIISETHPMISKQLHNVEKIIGESQSEMRALLLHLRPVKLNTKTLKEGIEQLLVELSTKIQMSIKYNIDDVKLPTSTEDNLFRIVQELLSNVLRHSKASELEVYLKKVDQRVQLRVIDDGIGFDMNKEHTGSYGLPNMKERISGLGGNVKIVSFPNQGTSVDIFVPVDLEENSD